MKQVAILYALNNGYLDDVEISKVLTWESAFHSYMLSNFHDLLGKIRDDADLSDENEQTLNSALEDFKSSSCPTIRIYHLILFPQKVAF